MSGPTMVPPVHFAHAQESPHAAHATPFDPLRMQQGGGPAPQAPLIALSPASQPSTDSHVAPQAGAEPSQKLTQNQPTALSQQSSQPLNGPSPSQPPAVSPPSKDVSTEDSSSPSSSAANSTVDPLNPPVVQVTQPSISSKTSQISSQSPSFVFRGPSQASVHSNVSSTLSSTRSSPMIPPHRPSPNSVSRLKMPGPRDPSHFKVLIRLFVLLLV
jgi:hypothetical protein